VPVPEPAHPEAIGLWKRWCDPEAPGPHVPRAHDAFVYDGAYVTLVGAPFEEQLLPDLMTWDPQRPFRLESRWTGDVLEMRIPAWLRYEDSDGARRSAFVEVGRLAGDRFVWSDSGEPAYERASRPLDAGPWRHLTEPRAPITDYDGEGDSLTLSVFRQVAETIRSCLLRAREHLLPDEPGPPGAVLVDLDPDGTVLEAHLGSRDRRLSDCGAAALRELSIEGYAAPERARYRLRFGVRSRSDE
jgi:hypothetical protein